MGTAPFKAIALPAVYRANLEFQSHVPFQDSRTRSRIRARADAEGSALLVHSFLTVLTLHSRCSVGILQGDVMGTINQFRFSANAIHIVYQRSHST